MQTCKHYHIWISHRLDGTLASKQERELEAHLDRCEGCRKLASELARTQRLLRALPELETSADFMGGLRSRLEDVRQPPLFVRRLRELLTGAADAVIRPRHAWQPAAAALIIIVAAGAFLATHQGPSDTSETVAAATLDRRPLGPEYFDETHADYSREQPFAVDAGWRFADYTVDR